MTVYTNPKDQCDVYATCGPLTICNSNTTPVCDCMKGFSIRSPNDWELEDRSGGCIRNTPLDCGTKNQSRDATTDKFYSMTGVRLPAMARDIEAVGSIDHCAQACLHNCSCTAYSCGNRCSLWYDDLLNIKQGNLGTTNDGEILYLRISAKDAESFSNQKRGKKKITGAVTAASVVALGLLTAFVMWFLLIWRNRRKQSIGMFNNVQGGNGIVAFRYIDLQHATKNFSENLGGGSFGAKYGNIYDSGMLQAAPSKTCTSCAMPLAFILFSLILLFSLHIPACSAIADTISAGEPLVGHDKLVSPSGRFALGFIQLGGENSSSRHGAKHWYLGIWFDKIPLLSKVIPIWVGNRDSPVVGHRRMSKLAISDDGNLVIVNRATESTVWSTRANGTAGNTTAALLDNGNLVLRRGTSSILWQSFDYPTDVILNGAKIGQDKITGLNRRIVSKKSLIDPAPGIYCLELDPTNAVGQYVFKLCNSSIVYWSSGEWNGQYFSNMPEMAGHALYNFKFINNSQEEYFEYSLQDEKLVTITILGSSGQLKSLFWLKNSQDWSILYTLPKDQCEIYATCGPFTICRNSNTAPVCDCMKGFSIRSPKDWELEDKSGGCIRNTPLDCGTRNQSRDATTDKFYSMTGVTLPAMARAIEAVGSIDHCAQACLHNCSCTAYSYGNRCSLWYDDLLNITQGNLGTTNDGEILYLRISAKDAESWRNNKRGKEKIIGAISAASVVALGLLTAFVMWFLLVWRKKRKQSVGMFNNVQGGNGIVAFRYTDLQHATKNFSEKLGGGSFGSVFKGLLCGSTAIAVKRLDGVRQGEKEFRAEVSSIGIIQHINLVKLIGFCCEGDRRLLVYEYMPHRSLDAYLFHSNTTVLTWSVRYQIALGIARGLAYLHESCRDCIIHCDIKPQNILLDTSFVPKVADFGMAKFLGRDFSRVLTTLRGTIGYLAPEWISGVAITPKVDVYSYGMMLLEMVSGQSNTCKENSSSGDHSAYFPVQVASKLLEGDVASLLDAKLLGDVNLDEAERVCKVACWCIQDEESNRPTMGEVVKILEGLLELEIPPMPRLLQAIVGSSQSSTD